MKKLYGWMLLLSGCFWLMACDNSKDEPKDEEAVRTVLVYFAADNSLSKFVSDDLAELSAGLEQLNHSNYHLLCYKDTGSKPVLVELKRDKNGVQEEVIKEYAESRNSVGVEEMKEVFSDVFGNPAFQSRQYGLVFWSHGEGWYPYPVTSTGTRWIGQDKSNGEDNRMNVGEFKEALCTAPHLDFLLVDACFAASLELVYEVKDYIDYYVGSPTETPGPGAPYDVLVPYLFQTSVGTSYVVPMAQAYFDHYNALYDETVTCTNARWTGGVSISVLKCDALARLAQATAQAWPSSGVDVDALRDKVFDYDQRSKISSSRTGYYDFVQMMEQTPGIGSAALQSWKTAYAEAVPFYQTTPKNYSSVVSLFSMEGSNGLSHYLPKSDSDVALTAYRATDWYRDAGLSKLGW